MFNNVGTNPFAGYLNFSASQLNERTLDSEEMAKACVDANHRFENHPIITLPTYIKFPITENDY